MTRTICCMQPTFLPWLGYFHLMSKVDEFVVLNDVQLAKPSWQTRNRIRTPYHYNKDLKQEVGWIWLTVPTRKEKQGSPRGLLTNVSIDYPTMWNLDHVSTLETYYKRSDHFDTYMPLIADVLKYSWKRLYSLNISIINVIRDYLEIKTTITMDSSLPYDRTKDKSRRLANLAQAMGADIYIEPQGGKSFLQYEPFDELGIKLRWQRFDHPVYKQLWEGPFVSHMSAVDAMFCLGPELKSVLKEREVFME